MKIGNIFKGDKVIWMVFFLLCVISVVEVFSASSQLAYKGGNYLMPVIKHASILGLGVICMIITLNMDCKYFKLFTPFALFGSAALLLWAFCGPTINDGARWISLLGIQFQPSEIAKGSLVLGTAQILSFWQTEQGADPSAFRQIVFITLVAALLIAPENLSTAILLCAVIFLMMVIGRVPWRQLGKLLSVVVLAGGIAVAAILEVGANISAQDNAPANRHMTEKTEKKDKGIVDKLLHRVPTWRNRLLSATMPEVPPEKVDLDKDAQKSHACIAIATSGIVGKGPGNSVQRDFLPQAFSDFIYAIIIEEMGIEGALVVLMLYLILLWRTGEIAIRCKNHFPAFLAMGLALLLVVQALFNMFVAVGGPVTGQPLPLISKGGTSSVINCIYIGVILSISRSAKRKGDTTKREEAPAVVTA